MKKLCIIAALIALVPMIHGAACSSSSGDQPVQKSLRYLATESYIKGLLDNQSRRGIFGSEDSLRSYLIKNGVPYYMIDQNLPSILPGVAHMYYLLEKGNTAQMPRWLQPYFVGVSIQDLIDHKMIPGVKRPSIFGEFTLDLRRKSINSLDGLRNVPGIGRVGFLRLQNNRLADINSGVFQGCTRVRVLQLSSNQLTNVQPGAFGGLVNLRWLHVYGNRLSDDVQQRISQEIRHVSPNAEVLFE